MIDTLSKNEALAEALLFAAGDSVKLADIAIVLKLDKKDTIECPIFYCEGREKIKTAAEKEVDIEVEIALQYTTEIGGNVYTAREVAFFFQAEDGIRAKLVTGVQTCALPI